MNLAGALLERAARATPAAVEDRTGGWWLRHADGSAWWSGAVLAHAVSDDGHLADRIEAAERFYAERDDAPRLDVQVEVSNTAACRLYAGAGFTELATYHYRVREVWSAAR